MPHYIFVKNEPDTTPRLVGPFPSNGEAWLYGSRRWLEGDWFVQELPGATGAVYINVEKPEGLTLEETFDQHRKG